MYKKVYYILPIALLISNISFAQVKDSTQIAFDKEGTIVTLGTAQETILDLFPEIRNFLFAKIYKNEKQGYSLEITLMNDYVTKRFLSEDDLHALQEKTSNKLKSIAGVTNDDKSQGAVNYKYTKPIKAEKLQNDDGRPAFLVGTTLSGLLLHSPCIANLTGAVKRDEERGSKITNYIVLVTGVESFVTPYLLTRNIDITKGMATLANYCAVSSVPHSVFLTAIFTPEFSDRSFQKTFQVIAPLNNILETGLGFRFAQKKNLTSAQSGLIGTADLLGNITGLSISAALYASFAQDRTSLFITPLVVSTLGAYAGYKYGQRDNYTLGDLGMVQNYSIAGFYASFALPYSLLPDQFLGSRVGLLLPAVLQVGSFALANKLMLNHDFQKKDIFNSAAIGAAGLVAGLLAGKTLSDSYRAPLFGSCVGSIAGLAFHYLHTAKNREAFNTEKRTDSRFIFNINPMAFIPNSMPKAMQPELKYASAATAVSLAYNF